MRRGFNGLGVCAQCGDTIGPWQLVGGIWLCDECAEEVKEQEEYPFNHLIFRPDKEEKNGNKDN